MKHFITLLENKLATRQWELVSCAVQKQFSISVSSAKPKTFSGLSVVRNKIARWRFPSRGGIVGRTAVSILCACALVMTAWPCRAGTVDDTCTSTLLPLTGTSVNGYSAGTFNQALANAGFANGWTINYVGDTIPYAGTLQCNFYDAWTLTPPNNLMLNGVYNQIADHDPQGASGWPADAAGASIQVECIQTGGVAVPNMHFIQMYTQGFRGPVASSSTYLDNPVATSPFYDSPTSTAQMNVNMSDGNFGSWFQDTPAKYEGAPDLSVDAIWNLPGESYTETFSLALVTTSPGPNNTTELNIYGGYQWGFTCTMVDTPETSSTFALLSVGAISVLACNWRRRMG